MAYTSGVVPSQPPSPTLEYASVTSLSLGWSKRPTDDSYTLQMEDSLNGYGFQPVYNGQETRFVCQGLRRNTYYKFRVGVAVPLTDPSPKLAGNIYVTFCLVLVYFAFSHRLVNRITAAIQEYAVNLCKYTDS